MYDELVKRLWECASGECFNCSQYTPTTNASVCQKELMKRAAEGGSMTEVKIVMDDYGLLYAILPDGTKRAIKTDVFGNPYYGNVRVGEELEEE